MSYNAESNKSSTLWFVFGPLVFGIIFLMVLLIITWVPKQTINGARLARWVALHKKHCKACKNEQPCHVVNNPPNFDDPETYGLGGAIHNEVMANAEYKSVTGENVGRKRDGQVRKRSSQN